MRARGELHCYHCGYLAATVEMPEGLGSKIVRIIPSRNGPGIHRSPERPPRCGRCGGRLFLEEVEAVPLKAIHPEDSEDIRLGRPRKVPELAQRPWRAGSSV